VTGPAGPIGRTPPLPGHDVAVPAYFHPVVRPELWHQLTGLADRLRFVVVNPASGPGEVADPTYAPVVTALHRARVRTVGYVDTAYGERSPAEVVAEAVLYRDRYGINGVFLDQATTALAGVSTYERYLLGLRASGMRFVVLNPGAHPHPAYCDMVNVTVTFEGTWSDYLAMQEPDWVRSRVPSRFSHLVYGTPGSAARQVDRVLRDRHAQTVCLTSGEQPNPWDRLPLWLGADGVTARAS
jgi:hypothetical protein